jgi:PAS domain S-box-containing protein
MFSIDSANRDLLILAAVCSLALIGLALFVPWRRLPRWTQATVPLAALPVDGILRDATGGSASPFTILGLLPILLFALYGNRREVGAAVLLQAGVLAAPPMLGIGTSNYSATELDRAILVPAVSLFIGVVVNQLVTRLRASADTVAQAEARAREARDQVVGLLEAATQFSIIATDAHGVVTHFNEGASRLLGYAPEEIIGHTPAILHDPEEVKQRAHELDLDPRWEVFVAAARASEADVQDWTYIKRSGERVTVSLTVTAVRASDGTATGFIAIGRDVTEERRNERLISEQAHRADLINDLTFAIRQDLDPTSVLRRATSALGECMDVDRVAIRFGPDDPLGRIAESWTREGVSELPLNCAPAAGIVRLSRRTAGDDSALVIFDVHDDTRLRPAEADELASFELQAYLGAPMWVGSRLMGWLSVHSTRGPRSWTRNDIAILQALARTVGAALLQAQTHHQEQEISRRLRELDQTKSDFVSSVSHELRTPLTSITGYLEMLVEGDAGTLNAEQMRLVEVVERNSLRLLNLIEQLLTLSRIEAGDIRPGREAVDLAAVIDEVNRAVLPMLSGRNLSFEVKVPADIGVVTGDTGQLEQVVLNLVTNAVKFTPDGGRVTVVAAGIDGRARLSVSDTGIGIPQDEQDQLFTRFFRSSTARQHAIQGTGLGLAIVKSIVEGHAGSIAVESTSGSGTTVTVELPLAVSALTTAEAA